MWTTIKSLLQKLFKSSTKRSGTEEYPTAEDLMQALLADHEAAGFQGWVDIQIVGSPDALIQVTGGPQEWTINIPEPPKTAPETLREQLRTERFKAFELVKEKPGKFCELRGHCSQEELSSVLIGLFESVYGWSKDTPLDGYLDGN
jgi:hypothetical protein